MELEFSQEALSEMGKIIERYPRREAALLPALRLAQREFGYLSPEALELVARTVGVPKVQAYSVATFYTLLRSKPVGRHLIQVCTNITCSLMGAEHILDHLCRKLGIGPGGTTSDGRLTLVTVECLGSCAAAPAMQIDDEHHEGLTPEKVDQILAGLQ